MVYNNNIKYKANILYSINDDFSNTEQNEERSNDLCCTGYFIKEHDLNDI